PPTVKGVADRYEGITDGVGKPQDPGNNGLHGARVPDGGELLHSTPAEAQGSVEHAHKNVFNAFPGTTPDPFEDGETCLENAREHLPNAGKDSLDLIPGSNQELSKGMSRVEET